MKIIFVRHGLSNSNILGKIEGHNNSKLSDKGRLQARATALRLKNIQISAIYSSDLARAKQTAVEISKYHKDVPIRFTKQLRERKWGIYEGKALNRANLKKWRAERDRPDFKHKGAESLTEAHLRIKAFIKRLIRESGGKTVVVVSHGYMGRVLLSMAAGESLFAVAKVPSISNASITIIEMNMDNRNKIHKTNDVRHLISLNSITT
jgi:probable phosphoglycerate mutase